MLALGAVWGRKAKLGGHLQAVAGVLTGSHWCGLDSDDSATQGGKQLSVRSSLKMEAIAQAQGSQWEEERKRSPVRLGFPAQG